MSLALFCPGLATGFCDDDSVFSTLFTDGVRQSRVIILYIYFLLIYRDLSSAAFAGRAQVKELNKLTITGNLKAKRKHNQAQAGRSTCKMTLFLWEVYSETPRDVHTILPALFYGDLLYL